MTEHDSTDSTNPAPPTPNPMFGGINRYPIPADGSPNRALALAVRDFIADLPVAEVPDSDDYDGDEPDLDPNGWVQEAWRCGSGMCYAGWTDAVAGAIFPFSANAGGYVRLDRGGRWETSAGTVVIADGEKWAIQDYARHLLNIDNEAADRLFAGGNDLDDITRLINEIF